MEVVALHMKPPDNAVVLCVEEKTGIKGLDRTQPMLPLRAAKPRSWIEESGQPLSMERWLPACIHGAAAPRHTGRMLILLC